MEKQKEIILSAEIVISKITNKEAVNTVTPNNLFERGKDNGRVDDAEEVGMGSKRRKWGGQYCSAVDCHSSTYRDGPRGVRFYRFPKDPVRRQGWIARVKNDGRSASAPFAISIKE